MKFFRALFLCITFFIPTSYAQGEVIDASTRLNLFKQLVEAIGAAGDAVAKLTDGVSHLVITGVHGYDEGSARVAYSQLVTLSKQTTDLTVKQNTLVVQTLEDYLRTPRPEQWPRVIENLQYVLVGVQELLSVLQGQHSEFVLQPAYETLSESLAEKALLLRKLESLPPPHTSEELSLLEQAVKKDKHLIRQLSSAKKELNIYIKQEEQAHQFSQPTVQTGRP